MRGASDPQRVEHRLEGGVGLTRIVAMGLGQVREPALTADDGDGGIGHGGEVAGQVADMSAAAVFVPGEVADVMESILDFPVSSDQSHQALGVGLCGGQRGQAVSDFGAGGAGLQTGALALDAEGLTAIGQVGIAVPLLTGQVEAAAAIIPGARSQTSRAPALVCGSYKSETI